MTDCINEKKYPAEKSGYRVLARKYRPQDFKSLVGQEVMVQTIKNSFITGRIPHAWILTGIRGVGKTTTARILARSLNYKTEQIDYACTDFQTEGEHCSSIMEGRHVDVIEMDAASHTGIDDIRNIIESVPYAPASGRFRVYIIDEVHMLSTQAFNGLLKTLEEPPAHVKFILATTEIRKVPVTILSRCQRFDLRRIDSATLAQTLKDIAELEKIDAEEKALTLIAKAAEGSMRDALSLLDQAILYVSGELKEETVRKMLGLADSSRIMNLFEHIIKANVVEVLEEFRAQYEAGVEPAALFTDLAEFTHCITRLRFVKDSANNKYLSEEEKNRGQYYAQNLSVSALSRIWQMLLKAITEIQTAPNACIAGEMALIRLMHASRLPTLSQALGQLEPIVSKYAEKESSSDQERAPQSSEQTPLPEKTKHGVETPQNPSRKKNISSLKDIAELAQYHRDMKFKVELKNYVSLIKIEQNTLHIALREGAPAQFAHDLALKLKDWTGENWNITLLPSCPNSQTLAEQEKEKYQKTLMDVENNPLVHEILTNFPGAHIVDIRMQEPSDTLNEGDEEFAEEE